MKFNTISSWIEMSYEEKENLQTKERLEDIQTTLDSLQLSSSNERRGSDFKIKIGKNRYELTSYKTAHNRVIIGLRVAFSKLTKEHSLEINDFINSFADSYSTLRCPIENVHVSFLIRAKVSDSSSKGVEMSCKSREHSFEEKLFDIQKHIEDAKNKSIEKIIESFNV